MSDAGVAGGRADVSRQSSKNLGGTHSSQLSGQNQNQDTIPVDVTMNHYELPNLTQLLYDFTNKE